MNKTISILKEGGIGVLPTDTLYGLVGSALNPVSVERIYSVRERDLHKPLIVLVSSINDLSKFDIELSDKDRAVLNRLWPGKISVILPCASERFTYLHRGTGAIAFRLSADDKLQAILSQTGPLVAPSANPQGKESARTIDDACTYFGGKVDFYEDGGALDSLPSTLVSLKNGKTEVLREGAVKV